MSNTNQRNRSERLDAFIGKNVDVMFSDKSFAIGVLGFCEKTDLQKGHKAGYYFIKRPQGDVIFRKSHVYRMWYMGKMIKKWEVQRNDSKGID